MSHTVAVVVVIDDSTPYPGNFAETLLNLSQIQETHKTFPSRPHQKLTHLGTIGQSRYDFRCHPVRSSDKGLPLGQVCGHLSTEAEVGQLYLQIENKTFMQQITMRTSSRLQKISQSNKCIYILTEYCETKTKRLPFHRARVKWSRILYPCG